MSRLRRRARAERAPEEPTSSLSLRWRVMLLAMSMVAMVVVLMAVAVYAVVSAALYTDIDNQLQSRASLLIASGSLAADPGKAIEGTAYSDVNAMLINLAARRIPPTSRARSCRSANRRSPSSTASC